MSVLEVVALAAAGGVGAGLRYLVDRVIQHRRSGGFPLGILVVNVTGSFVLGLLVGLGAGVVPDPWLAVAGVGLLGGYTTFSTVSVETVLLAQRRRRLHALLNVLGTLALSLIAAGLGLAIGALAG